MLNIICDIKLVYLPDVMLLTASCIHAARPRHTALTEIVHQALWDHVCVCLQYVWVSMHPLHIVILQPLYSSHISYKMTHLRNCCLSRPCTPQPLPGAHGQHVCVVCVNVCSLCVSVFLCVSLLDHFLWLWRWTGRGEEFFFSQDIWEWWTERKYHTVIADCRRSFFGKCGSLNLDTEKEGCIVSPQWQITCLDRSVEFSFIGGGQDPSDRHKTRFNLCWEKQSWLLSLSVFLWAWPHRVFDWELQTSYCSQTNEGLEWHTADTGCTPVRITARLSLHWNLIFALQLNLLLS